MLGLEIKDDVLLMVPGPYDAHGHPRIHDPITDNPFNSQNLYEGKAGLPFYTQTLLESGLVQVSAMPNEFYRRLNPEVPGGIELVQYPTSDAFRASEVMRLIATQSRARTTFHLGVERQKIIYDEGKRVDLVRAEQDFREAGIHATALKLFGDVSTGGQNIPIEHIPALARLWHERYPHKPIILHLENENVRLVLEAIKRMTGGSQIPIHIAHVSSQEELEPIIEAKGRGMNVTCEATPHHLFLNAEEGGLVGGYGCVKPTLKPEQDRKFLREHIQFIDILASDCAPHQVSDKEADPPTFGLTNHTVFMPLFMGAIAEGWLTPERLYEMVAIKPRQRFNLPLDDGTRTITDLSAGYASTQQIEAELNPRYGQNVFPHVERLGRNFTLVGKLLLARSGHSEVIQDRDGRLVPSFRTSLDHFVPVA